MCAMSPRGTVICYLGCHDSLIFLLKHTQNSKLNHGTTVHRLIKLELKSIGVTYSDLGIIENFEIQMVPRTKKLGNP